MKAVSDLEGKVTDLGVQADGLSAEISQQTQDMENIRTDMTSIKATAEGLHIEVKSIIDNGVTKVKTPIGYTFDDEGLNITKEGDEIENLINNRGVYVGRGNQTMLKADADGVEATDVTVNNYLRVAYSRFEKYNDGTGRKRTGLYYVG